MGAGSDKSRGVGGSRPTSGGVGRDAIAWRIKKTQSLMFVYKYKTMLTL